ncbi:hypothetical protein H6F42_12525 [Pseudanabaena sp. FACHB-1998]|uniref:hypothetical protein n=1 Tax=Pseudanabaena sp. FACHB-1998 TaxID=2692858 RepID=UPI0016812A8E|nr:hypothetical protein [Pseudanabaena sp. FACHB-1998]MBD2177739.1 hypothetical protein [Pseudanabaena sp. FACHB-1998]
MTQVSVMELAKQGDPHAIAALINRSLESKGIHAQAQLEDECLKISLQASQIPNQKAVVTIIHRGMLVLQIPQIKRVKVFTYRSDNNYLAWQHEFSLSISPPNSASPSSEFRSLESQPLPPSPSGLVTEPKNTHLTNNYPVNNYQGAILVQKLSQIQQNLQEYQDIIVRFTDEHVGTVRCLTTLTELIQVISKPSFLFAAVASNPSLRSLLDTIAEFSKTDEHGDQVITNLSILQPGQQWQKAKIRLVSKIFLEPAQDPTNVENKHQGITLDLDKTLHQPVGYSVLETSEPATPPSPSVVATPTEESTSISSESSSESLFDDFPESPTSDSQEILDQPEPVNTTESLFEDFSEPNSPDLPDSSEFGVTESSNTVESLFDDFMTDVTEAAGEYGDISSLDESLSVSPSVVQAVNRVADETAPLDVEEGDLFGDFLIETPSPKPKFSRSDISDIVNNPEDNLDVIKSRIPKQNLETLLKLMDEQEQTPTEVPISANKQPQNKKDASNDLGATTIERILGGMETLVLNGDGGSGKSEPDFVTLENFSNDLDSLGF